MYTEAIFKPQIWHNDNKLYFIINYKYNYYFYSYFVVLYSFEIKYKQAYPLLHKRVCEGLTHKPHSLIIDTSFTWSAMQFSLGKE